MNAALASSIATAGTETGVDPSGAVRIMGVTLVGVSATTGVKLLFTLALIVVVVALQAVARVVLRRVLGGQVADPRRFWARQGLQVILSRRIRGNSARGHFRCW